MTRERLQADYFAVNNVEESIRATSASSKGS